MGRCLADLPRFDEERPERRLSPCFKGTVLPCSKPISERAWRPCKRPTPFGVPQGVPPKVRLSPKQAVPFFSGRSNAEPSLDEHQGDPRRTGMTNPDDPRRAFIEAAIWHGTLERAEAILAAHPEVAGSDILTAAILGDDAAVRRFLALDSGNATVKGGPHGGDALVYLCLSKYLRLDRARSDDFLLRGHGAARRRCRSEHGVLDDRQVPRVRDGARRRRRRRAPRGDDGAALGARCGSQRRRGRLSCARKLRQCRPEAGRGNW